MTNPTKRIKSLMAQYHRHYDKYLKRWEKVSVSQREEMNRQMRSIEAQILYHTRQIENAPLFKPRGGGVNQPLYNR
jgi:hypothetical protein